MIKGIFLPEKIGNYYIFPKRVVGIDINKQDITATKAYLAGTKTTIVQFAKEKIGTGDYNEARVAALKLILASARSFDAVISTVDSASAVYKTLYLPFTSYEKIKMVIDFEVAPLLPFSLQEVTIDFIITAQEENSSTVFVGAVPNKAIEEKIALFTQAGVQPEKIIIDLFALYGLYKEVPAYQEQRGGIALINLQFDKIEIAYLYNNQLMAIRSIGQGINTIVKQASKTSNKNAKELLENMLRNGLDASDQATKKAFATVWQSVRFTLNSFVERSPQPDALHKLLLLGQGGAIKNCCTMLSEIQEIPCELFDTKSLLQKKDFSLKKQLTIPYDNIISLAVAIPSTVVDTGNLQQKQFAVSDTTSFTKQIIVSISLFTFLLIILFGYNFWQFRKFNSAINRYAQQAISQLHNQFGPKIKESSRRAKKMKTRLNAVITDARDAITTEKKQWFAFSAPARASFLLYLIALSQLDKEGLGLTVNKITISDGTLTLKGEVMGKGSITANDAVIQLQKQLREIPLFKSVSKIEEPKFTVEITLQENGQDE